MDRAWGDPRRSLRTRAGPSLRKCPNKWTATGEVPEQGRTAPDLRKSPDKSGPTLVKSPNWGGPREENPRTGADRPSGTPSTGPQTRVDRPSETHPNKGGPPVLGNPQTNPKTGADRPRSNGSPNTGLVPPLRKPPNSRPRKTLNRSGPPLRHRTKADCPSNKSPDKERTAPQETCKQGRTVPQEPPEQIPQ